jgi:RNA polymerase sigma factor, sigma-70 family
MKGNGNGRRRVHEEDYELLQSYFREVETEPLLTPAEEVEMSLKIKRYENRAKEIKTYLDRTRWWEPENGLGKQICSVRRKRQERKVETVKFIPAGRIERFFILMRSYLEEASVLRERFIKANLSLVVSLAQKYQGRGLPLADLIQEGNIGLMKAVEKFDHSEGYRFSIYASRRIIRSISRALSDQKRVVRMTEANALREESNENSLLDSVSDRKSSKGSAIAMVAIDGDMKRGSSNLSRKGREFAKMRFENDYDDINAF